MKPDVEAALGVLMEHVREMQAERRELLAALNEIGLQLLSNHSGKDEVDPVSIKRVRSIVRDALAKAKGAK